MNQVKIFEVASERDCSFELASETKDKTSKSEELRIIVKCKDGATKDNWVKIIEDQLFLLHKFKDFLEVPTATLV